MSKPSLKSGSYSAKLVPNLTSAQFKETSARFKETDARFKETDAKLKESDARFDRRMRKLEGLFGNQWGRLLEALVKPDVLRLFQTRGIPVHNLYHRAEAHIDLQKSFVPSSHWKMWLRRELSRTVQNFSGKP